MKRRKKIILSAVSVLILIPAVVFCVKTESGQIALHRLSDGYLTTSNPIQVLAVEQASSAGKNIRDDGNIAVKNILVIDGQKNRLLCTFDDPAKAMENEKRNNARFLKMVQKKWRLAELSDSNWKDYKQHLVQYTAGELPEDLGGESMYPGYMHITNFLEIYEDGEKNRHALDYVSYANDALKSKKIPRISLDPLAEDVPYDSPISGSNQRRQG